MKDMQTPVRLHEGDKSIQLPLINILRIVFLELDEIMREYTKQHPTASVIEMWDWFLREKLEVKAGDTILT